MNENTTSKIFARISLFAGIAFLATILLLTVLASRSMLADCQAMRTADFSKMVGSAPFRATIRYNDHLYASQGFGIEISPHSTNPNAQVISFISDSLRTIDKRLTSCMALYTMIFDTLVGFYLYHKFGARAKTHTLAAILSAAGVYAFFLLSAIIIHTALGSPFYFPSGAEWPAIFVSLLAIMGGNCFLAWMLRTINFKKTAALAMIPAVLAIFTFGANFESLLYSPETIDSFAYLTEIEPALLDDSYDGECYYDNEKNVTILNGIEYQPEQIENPDHIKGGMRVAGYAFEMLLPYAGNSLYMMQEAAEAPASGLMLCLYAAKAAVLIILPFFLKRKEESTPVTA